MVYKHGVYTEDLANAGRLGQKATGTIPAYIGTAPINLASDANNKANTPMLIRSYKEAVNLIGYSDNWETYTLCEAIAAHFKNRNRNVSPIIVVNMFDVAKHTTAVSAGVSVTLSNGVGYISNDDAKGNKIVLSTLTSAELKTDFKSEYTSDNRVRITYTGASTAPASASFTYSNLDISKITATEFTSALDALDYAYVKCKYVPSIIAAPTFSHLYAKDMIAKCEGLLGGKWGCVAYIDIPTETVDTLAEAKTYGDTNNINSKLARLHFPKAKADGRVYHLSVLSAQMSQAVDTDSDNVACFSNSNKVIMCDVPCLDADTEMLLTEAEANELNEVGVTTVNYIGGTWRLWGGQMANYRFANVDNIEPQDRSDATVRMKVYLDNWLKLNHLDAVDFPMARRDIDNLVSNVNIGLNSFVRDGYLLAGECVFNSDDNTTDEIARGDLLLYVSYTSVPNGKSITFQLQYDVNGLETIYEEVEG